LNSSNKTNLYNSTFDINKEKELKKNLTDDGFSFKSIDYAFWRAQKDGVTATLYLSGKILVQGKNAEDFAVKYLNAAIQKSLLKAPEQNIKNHNYSCWIGSDESGKGDYFGPLVIAAVLIDQDNLKKFQDLGVKDSKKINDITIQKLAAQIKADSVFSVVVINPEKYNELYSKFNNLNKLLAWGHARAIENILEKKQCQYVISDKFGDEKLIQNALLKHGKTVTLEQRVRAEDDIAVAAASILARDEFVKRLAKLSAEYGINLPKGASSKVTDQAALFVKKYGSNNLFKVCKLHFKFTLKFVL